jgi:PleD family two-component response regulator
MPFILILDDSPKSDQFAQIVRVLASAACTVRAVQDWAQCHAALSESTPDVVLLDVTFCGMRGDVLAMQLKRHPKLQRARVAFHSATNETDLQIMTRRSGADGYIVKGAEGGTFRKAIQTLLGTQAKR